ncbi:MAG: apolipoprotein N-acyltransferase [Nitrospinae bacterium]|nr:apolipoprotein N-acyltransferase [Nitrospinota bacterium]
MTKKTNYSAAASDLGIAAISGLALAASFPDMGLWGMAWVALVPLLYSIRGKSVTRGFFMGFVFGLIYFELSVWWVINTITEYGHLPLWMAAIVQTLLITTMACYTGLFGGAVAWVSSRVSKDMGLAMAPFGWVTIEFFRIHSADFSFPWARIADSQYLLLPLIQIADVAGEEGLGFIIVMFNAALVKTVEWGVKRLASGGKEPLREKFPAVWVLISFGLVAACLIYGFAKLDKTYNGTPVSVALIQGNIDQARKWDRSYIQPQIDIYMSRTLEAARNGAKLIIWPEAAAPFVFGKDPKRDPAVLALARDFGADMILGAPWAQWEDGAVHEYNRAWLIRPDGMATSYDKLHLVPFGEYVPFQNILRFISRVVVAIGEMKPGGRITLLDAGEFKAGAQICYEIIFPEYSREIARLGGGVIVNITNDSWYGDSPASRQSMAMGVFRAVENRLPLLRAAQSGVSAIISPDGRILAQTPLFVETTLNGSFTPATGGEITMYGATGDLFDWLCAAASLLFMVYAYTRGARSR